MVKEIGFKSGAEVGRVGCPRTTHMLCYWDCSKSVPGLCELDQNRPYVVCLNC